MDIRNIIPPKKKSFQRIRVIWIHQLQKKDNRFDIDFHADYCRIHILIIICRSYISKIDNHLPEVIYQYAQCEA